jgi:hypothetical protein
MYSQHPIPLLMKKLKYSKIKRRKFLFLKMWSIYMKFNMGIMACLEARLGLQAQKIFYLKWSFNMLN